MVRLNYLESYTVYRTKPPVIMPESKQNKRKGQAYIILAPDIKSEMDYLTNTIVLSYRFLENYFLEKRWDISLYGQGHKVIKPNEDGDITALLNAHRTGALSGTKMQQFLPTVKTSPMKGFNVLIEVNHVVDTIMNNPKDRRMLGIRMHAMLPELKRAIAAPYIGVYDKTLVIPMELWLKANEFKNPDQLFKPKQYNPMGILLQQLCETGFRQSLGVQHIVLQAGPYILILDPTEPKKGRDDPNKIVKNLIVQFLRKSKNTAADRNVADEIWDTDADEEDDNPSLSDAERRTEEELGAEVVMDAMKIDQSNVSIRTKEEVKQQIATEVDKKIKADVKSEQKPVTAPKSKGTVQAAPVANERIPAKSKEVLQPDSDNKHEPYQDKPEAVKINIDDKTADVILKAQMEGRSVAQERRNELLRNKYTTLKFGDRPIEEMIKEQASVEIPKAVVAAHTVNEDFKTLKSARFEEAYDESLSQHDLVSILMHFASADPPMYLNKDIEIEDVSSRTDRVIRYGVEFEDNNRKRHRFHFKLPKMYKNRYLYLNGQELVITHQKLPFPITKVNPERCQLVTNYNKIFVYRYGTAISPRMNKLKKLLSADNISTIKAKRGDCTKLHNGDLTTIEYDELSGNFVRIDMGKGRDTFTFMFDPELYPINGFGSSAVAPRKVQAFESREMIEDNTLIPLGIQKSSNGIEYFWTSGTSNLVYDKNGKSYDTLSDFVINRLVQYAPSLQEALADTTANTRYMYSRVHIMAQDIPLVLVMGAADPNGLIGALEKGKMNYEFVDKRPAVDKTVKGVIPFADGYLVFDRYPFENSLIFNGLSTIPTKEYSFYDLNTRDAYVDIFDLMCGQRSLVDNLASFYYMMIDPITKEVLQKLNMPTDFITLLFWCNGVLADNQFQIDSNYENSRVRSNEIIMAHLYRELAVAWSQYKAGRADTFSIYEDAIIKLLMTSKIVDPKSKLNIALELENDRNIKLKGPSGMNEDHSFTIEKRAYHPSMRGIVGSNSTPSGEVGINRHMVVNSNIDDARGFITVNKKDEYEPSELMTPGEFLQPFAVESADMERVCMSISQLKHLVPVKDQCSTPVSYDFERVAPYLSNDFAVTAKKNGRVVEINEDIMIVQYEDGSFDDIDLAERPQKNTDGGFHVMSKMDTKMKAGNRFKAGEILAFDKNVVNDLDFFGDPCVNVGTLARVSFESNGNVYEDAGYITDKFAHQFATNITKQKRVILSKYANIKKIVKIGDRVEANDVILAFDDTEDEFSSQLLASFAEQLDDEDEVMATTAPVTTKYTGVIKDIQITYTVPPEEMSESLRKIVESYCRQVGRREKELAKFIPVTDANTLVKSSEMAVQDSQGKVAGTKVGDGVIIDFFIEYEDIAGNGDKGSIGALKFTTCYVIPQELAGYTESNQDRKIDVSVASFGAFKRMVADVEKIGILTKVLVETKRRMKDKYGERIKRELAKK